MHIEYIPMRWGTGDNYCYLLTDTKTKKTLVIDPAEPEEVIPVLEKKKSSLKFVGIINTHHHYDHSGGNLELLNYISKEEGNMKIPCYTGTDSKYSTHVPKHGEILKLGSDIEIKALHTPCHTQDSICWYAKDLETNEKALFSGDTIFNLGNGRFFEGTGEEMVKIIYDILPKNVDPDTLLYPGHEYTNGNAKFAKSVMPHSEKLLKYIDRTKNEEFTTGKFTLQDEINANPFFNLDNVEILKATDGSHKSKNEIMDRLRIMKNQF